MSTIKIYYFSDYTTYRYYMTGVFPGELQEFDPKTVVADSHTFQSLYARKEQEIINPMEKFAKGTDTRQWFSGETDAAEDMVIIHYGQLVEVNVVLVCHVNRDTTLIANEAVRGPFARGRLASMSLPTGCVPAMMVSSTPRHRLMHRIPVTPTMRLSSRTCLRSTDSRDTT